MDFRIILQALWKAISEFFKFYYFLEVTTCECTQTSLQGLIRLWLYLIQPRPLIPFHLEKLNNFCYICLFGNPQNWVL